MLDGISRCWTSGGAARTRLRQFVADASHELRTPVAAVRGYTDLYNAGALPDDAAVERAMQRMGFEARRMGALVDDLLTLIQADAERTMTHERVDLADLLTGVVDDAAVIDPTRTWRLAGGYGPAIVVGDRLRLHQLFANLLANVRTHTPTGTMATVSVLPGLDEIAVSVSDNGPGVSDEALQRLFDRFYRVDAVPQPGERRHRPWAVDRGGDRPVARRPDPGVAHPGRRADDDRGAAAGHRNGRGPAADGPVGADRADRFHRPKAGDSAVARPRRRDRCRTRPTRWDSWDAGISGDTPAT